MTAAAPNAPRRYAALGDSFTAGALGSGEPPFADHLAELLREPVPSLRYANLAVPGARTPEVADHQLPATLELRPDVVTLVCGGSDALLCIRPDVHAHMSALERMLEVLAPHTLVVTATTPDPGRFLGLDPRSGARISSAMQRINEATQAAAARLSIPCLDFAARPEALARGDYARAGHHPSPEACRRAATAFGAVIGVQLGIQLDTQEVI